MMDQQPGFVNVIGVVGAVNPSCSGYSFWFSYIIFHPIIPSNLIGLSTGQGIRWLTSRLLVLMVMVFFTESFDFLNFVVTFDFIFTYCFF